MKNNKYLIPAIIAVGIIIWVIGGTLAYWNWQSTNAQATNVTFTVGANFSCSADGGGSITNTNYFVPTDCTNSTYAIKREITTNITNSSSDTIYLDMWLNIDSIDSGLTNSENFKYALTTSSNSCTTGVVSKGNFNGKQANDKINLLKGVTTASTYYLYIWLDAAETSTSTMNQSVSLSLGGECANNGTSCPNQVVPVNNSVPNQPVLDAGMIPVKISNNGTVTTTTSSDTTWYNYQNKEWANAVLVKETGVKTRAENKVNGTVINPSDILAYYVWIPRYKYAFTEQMTCGCISDVNETDYPSCYETSMSPEDKASFLAWGNSKGYTTEENNSDADKFIQDETAGGYINDDISEYNNENDPDIEVTYTLQSDNIVNNPRTIDIVFESGTPSKSTGTAIGTSYYTHPAFTFGTEELPGFWVGKFEATGDTTTPTILPNVTSLRSQNVSTQFATSLKFAGGTQSGSNVTFAGNSTYGLASTADSHMMKNTEWGAVAYLSHSVYGINDEIRINNYWNDGTLTGCGAGTSNASESTICDIAYGSTSSYPQSTTGNISGVFDISGGAYEYTMSHWSNSLSTPQIEYSGFSTLPTSKYIDIYSDSVFTGNDITNMGLCTLATCGGHALYETAGWYNDNAYFVSREAPWWVRGGRNDDDVYAGAFNSGVGAGAGSGVSNGLSWRSTLVAR